MESMEKRRERGGGGGGGHGIEPDHVKPPSGKKKQIKEEQTKDYIYQI